MGSMVTRQGMVVRHLKAWRNSKLLSQSELAVKSGVTQTSISRIEAGLPARYATVDKLAEALGVTREQLIFEKPPKRTNAA